MTVFKYFIYAISISSNIEQVMKATPHKAAAVRPPTTHHENYQN